MDSFREKEKELWKSDKLRNEKKKEKEKVVVSLAKEIRRCSQIQQRSYDKLSQRLDFLIGIGIAVTLIGLFTIFFQ